ncbi:MAG: hypothetical protein HC897_13025 [Thermoanaerobaculia bacterium]|nr:hypothetical protein [Thermoanaerobaculia bacterium]
MHRLLIATLVLGMLAAQPAAAGFKTRIEKPDHGFFFYQYSLAGGWDTREPGDFGLADRGPRTQFTLEWLSKDERNLQRGYTRLFQPSQWNFKIALEADPAENDDDRPGYNLRLFDVWVQFSTKWDRTNFWLGHRSLPYGQNPKLDPELTFMPNQAPLDLGFGRDTGFFLVTPVSPRWDLDLAVTAGGFLDRPLVVVQEVDGSYDVDETIDYRSSWLVTARLGRPRFERVEIGVFAAVGSTHRVSGPLTDVARIGFDWVVKRQEDWKLVTQLAVGESGGDGRGSRAVANLLNSFELYLGPRWRLGVTNAWRSEDFDAGRQETGTVFGMVSYATTRDSRIRLHPFLEYHDATSTRDSGVLVQLCLGCGWRK